MRIRKAKSTYLPIWKILTSEKKLVSLSGNKFKKQGRSKNIKLNCDYYSISLLT